MSDEGSSGATFVVSPAQAGRADRAVALAFPAVGRRRLAELFAAGDVRVDGKRARKGDRVGAGAVVTLAAAPVGRAAEHPSADEAAAARLGILLERPDLVAVDKPAPMPSQPLRAGERGSVAAGLAHRYPECATLGDDPRDGGLVHRLDIGTTGVLLAARTAEAYRALRTAFSTGQVVKTYLAVTAGEPVATSCSASLAQRGRKVVIDEAHGLAAHTDVTVIARAARTVVPRACLVRCTARTGRMHQVRAHLALLDAPIIGDALYGAPSLPAVEGLLPPGAFLLHAEAVELTFGGAPLLVKAPAPALLRRVLEALDLSDQAL